jgi:tryptophan halogenase
MLQGLGYLPKTSLPVLDHLNDRNAIVAFQEIRDRTQVLCDTLPTQYDYLTSVHQRQAEMAAAR